MGADLDTLRRLCADPLLGFDEARFGVVLDDPDDDPTEDRARPAPPPATVARVEPWPWRDGFQET